MKIYTSYFAKYKKIKELGYLPISIARVKPSHIDCQEILQFAPSSELLWKAKVCGISHDEYEKTYREEIENCGYDFNNILNDKSDINVVFMCYEKPVDFCHRHILAEIIKEKTGVEIKELDI